MLYDTRKAVEYLESYPGSPSSQTIYEALNISGISYVSFKNTDSKPSLQWSKSSSLDECFDFWKQIIHAGKISSSNNNKICCGDVLLRRNQKTESFTEMEFVLSVSQSSPTEKVFTTWGAQGGPKTLKYLIKTNYYLISFSRINNNLLAYHNLIFKADLINKQLFTKMVFACCPERKMVSTGRIRENSTRCYLFSKIDTAALQNEIEKNCKDSVVRIEDDNLIAKAFVSTLFLSVEDQRKSTIVQGNLDSFQNGRVRATGCLSEPIVANFFQGKLTADIARFFHDTTNREVFQERLSLILQYFFLWTKRNSSYIIMNQSPKCYSRPSTEIKEYVTFRNDEFKRAEQIVRYFCNNKKIVIDSLFTLSGYIFDAIGGQSGANTFSEDIEYTRFQELVGYYGTGSLNYYMALERFKGKNLHAAEALADIYRYGREFEGFKVEKNHEKAIKILEPYKEYSVSARWTIGENYLLLSKESTGAKAVSYREMAQSSFESCGDYHPALNSLSNLYRLRLKENRMPDKDARPYAKKAVEYVTKAASFGLVYSFNNLFTLLTDKYILRLLSDPKGQRVIKQAYHVLEPTKVTDETSKIIHEFNVIKRNLKNGTRKTVEKYDGTTDIEFKYVEPIENPINFLMVSAYFGELWGINHLGMQLYERGEKEDIEKARSLFENAALYGHWGNYNLAYYVYKDDPEKSKEYYEKAARLGNTLAKEELKRK